MFVLVTNEYSYIPVQHNGLIDKWETLTVS